MPEPTSTHALHLYYAGYEECEPGHSFGPAIRPHYVMHYILKGRGFYEADNKRHQLKAGDAFLITPGIITYYKADIQDPWVYCWIGFSGYEVPEILKRCGLDGQRLIYHGESPQLCDAFQDISDAFQEQNLNHYGYLSILYRIFSHMALESQEHQSKTGTEYVAAAIGYIRHNYVYDIRISDVARHIGIDRTYLYRLFMDEQGISPQQYLIRYRLQIAGRLLEESNYSITEIAYSCGFKDSPSFCRHLKKKHGVTPLEYRKGAIHKGS